MNDNIDPAILAAAQRAIGPGSCTCREGHNQYGYWRVIDMTCPMCGDSEAKARAVIEAAAPLIAAKALRDFADAHRLPFIVFQDEDNYPHTVNDLLRAAAEGYAKKVQS